MSNHPNRSRRHPHAAANPDPAEIKAAREQVGLTQRQAAELIYMTERAWIKYESGERRLHPQHWESWRYKARLIDHLPGRWPIGRKAMLDDFEGEVTIADYREDNNEYLLLGTVSSKFWAPADRVKIK